MSSRFLNVRGLTALMTAGVCLSIALLTWFGYRAIREWRRSSFQLIQQRADQAADLLVTALARDMHAVQNSVLTSRDWNTLMLNAPYDVAEVVASAFARYPYPESFFAWRGGESPPRLTFFNPSARPPAWVTPQEARSRFPVAILGEPPFGHLIADRVQQDVRRRRRFSMFDLRVADVDYQVVAQLSYRDPFREQLDGVFGFMVSVPWVRRFYFQELTGQVSRIGNTRAGLTLSVIDDREQRVASTGTRADTAPLSRRAFPMMFFDPLLVALDSSNDLARRSWTVQVGVAGDALETTSIAAINRTMVVVACAVATLALGLVLTARAMRASVKLAEMRSEFVSTVTHELKAPIATIRVVGDTLVSGRLANGETLREYAQIIVQESKRLARLVDNLLAYARIADVTEAYSFEPVDISGLVEGIQREFCSQLLRLGFQVHVDIPQTLPPVRADRTAVELLFNNLVDNAIRYSDTRQFVAIRARPAASMVAVDVVDHGVGIPDHEIRRVVRRFVRGRGAAAGGSGLGLAIANRIATDHGGALTIRSAVDVGTTVTVVLPIARSDA